MQAERVVRMTTDELRAVYAAIGEFTPLKEDCGRLCGAACCEADEDGRGGVCLLPGEETLLHEADWGEITHEQMMDRPMLICHDTCDREWRPFLCRVFPLCPVKGDKGWTVRMDARAKAVCTLSRGGVRSLDPEFVRGCVRAVRLIARDAEGEKFLSRWAEIEAAFREPLW